MRTTDISKYKEKPDSGSKGTPSTVKSILSTVGKFLLTVLLIVFIAGMIVVFNLIIYLVDLSTQPSGVDLDARSLNLSSFIYVEDPETGEFYEYKSLYSSENRVWVDYNFIPKAMKDAIVAIEDKRFESHNGVDWFRTGSAVFNLATKGDDSYGGSTITQQLVKNITDDDEVSINRKIREIVKALKVENEYTKDEILEAYLNVVNFGSNCQGVQAASQRYFGKDITDCSVAQCAAIAGITQNPSKWDPLIYPDNNKLRRNVVLKAMFDQGKLTEEEYKAAKLESESMTFAEDSGEDKKVLSSEDIQNWYTDELFFDLREDLAEYYNISEAAAAEKLYTEGLIIYSAMDVDAQKMIEEEAVNIDKSSNEDLQIGMSLVGFDGRVIATAGSSQKKEGNLVFDRATMAGLQPGSSIKPVVTYPYAVDHQLINWSSVIKDQTLDSWIYEDGTNGPTNWYGYYVSGGLLLVDAIEWSSNACAAQTLEMIGGPTVAYEHATTYLGFEHLNPEADPYTWAGFSLGGMNGGVSAREMASAYTYIGNGGQHYEPYTYYYVTDQRNNVILDNRNKIPTQAYSEDSATIMNRLLNYNVNNCAHTTAAYARVSGWEIAGKTGTTNSNRDSWFCGCSPYAALAVWTGFDEPATIWSPGTVVAASTFSTVMGRYLEDKEHKDFTLSPNVETAEYCTYTGKLATDICTSTETGYYTSNNMPEKCYSHVGPGVGEAETETTTAVTEPTTQATIGIEFEVPTPAGNSSSVSTDPAQ